MDIAWFGRQFHAENLSVFIAVNAFQALGWYDAKLDCMHAVERQLGHVDCCRYGLLYVGYLS